jgi:hypothetical protein
MLNNITLMMEAVRRFETSVCFKRLHGATSLKAVIFPVAVSLPIIIPFKASRGRHLPALDSMSTALLL